MTEFEGEESDWNGWGAGMWWSHYDGDTNLGDAARRRLRPSTPPKVRTGSGNREEIWLWVACPQAARDREEYRA